MRPPDEAWSVALDRLDEYVDALDEALDRGDIAIVPGFRIPTDLPPLPATFAARARDVERRHTALQRRVRAQLLASSRRLSRTRTPSVPQRPTGRRFEAHA